MATNSLPRWLISITDMPASCQLTNSHFAFSSTSTGMVAGPAPKLKMRAAGLMGCGRAAFGFAFALRAVSAAVCAVFAVFAIFAVWVQDALYPRELLALGKVDER